MIEVKRRITEGYFNFAYEKYKPLIERLARKIGYGETQIEDMKSLADTEVLKCLICYNGQSAFMTFLYMRLYGLFTHFRDSCKVSRSKTISLNSVYDIANKDVDINLRIIAQECLECLNKNEKEIIIDLFFCGKNLQEVADQRNTVASTIQRVKTKAIKKMQLRYSVGRI